MRLSKKVCLLYFPIGYIVFMNIDLEKTNKDLIKTFHNPIDLIVRNIRTPFITADLVFIDSMLDGKQFDYSVITPLVEHNKPICADIEGLNGVLTCSTKILSTENYEEMVNSIAAGDAVLNIENAKSYFIISTRRSNGRNVEEPPTSSVIKGPREGFVEDIKNNMILLRRKLRTPNLIFEQFTLGRFSRTTVCISYIKNIALEDVIERIKERIGSIDIDGIIDSSFVSKFLETKVYSIFKQVGNSEKPDVIANRLLKGKIAIIVDGSPIVLTLPYVILEDFEDLQDDYKRPSRVIFLRLMRGLGVFFAVVLPAFYVAVQMHQYQMIPHQLLITILNANEGLPFSPSLEMIIAIILFEILGEASIRMPRYVGMALSVVGALVLGDTAVKAGVLSSITVLMVALSGIGIYGVPDEVGTFSILRFIFIIVAGITGVFGLIVLGMIIIAYLLNFEEYGVQYLAPLVPLSKKDFGDIIFKKSMTEQKYRLEYMNLKNRTKLKIKDRKQNE